MTTPRWPALLLCLALAGPAIAGHGAELEADELGAALDGDRAHRAAAVDFILAEPAPRTSLEMLVGAARAVQLGRVEDAGVLYYGGEMRARYELDAYRSDGPDAGTPAAAVRQLSHQLGRAIHPAILDNPERLEAVVRRLEDWPVRPPEGYSPAWPVQSEVLPEVADRIAGEIRETRLGVLRDYLVAVRDDVWQQALEDIRAYNGLSSDRRDTEAARERLADAQRRIERAEDRLDVCLLGAGCRPERTTSPGGQG